MKKNIVIFKYKSLSKDRYFLISLIFLALTVPFMCFSSEYITNSSEWISGKSFTKNYFSSLFLSVRGKSILLNAKLASGSKEVGNIIKEFKSGKNLAKSLISCSSISTLDCEQLQVNLPLRLSFEGNVPQTLLDKNGIGTGFTMADIYTGTRHSADGSPAIASVPGYEASKLTLINGTLQLRTNKGIAFTANNNQINALGVKIDTRGRLTIETKILNPINGTRSQQAGIWFGLHNKTYFKLVITGNKVELRREINDFSGTADQRITSIIAGTIQTIRLRMIVDPATNKVEGFYSLNGVTYLNAGASYSTKTLSLSGTGLTGSTAYAGIFATHRNATSPVTYTFDDFAVTPNKAPVVVQLPTDQQVPGSTPFSFSAGQYADPDEQDVLKYTATLANGSALPEWLKFNSQTLVFSGTTPPDRTTVLVIVTATDPEKKSVSTTFKILVNSIPVIFQSSADQIIPAGQPFSFTTGHYKDADTNDVLTYSAILADSNALPNWLNFNSSDLTFSGTPPAGGISFLIKVTATDQMLASVSDTFNLKVNTIPTVTQTPVDQVFVDKQTFNFSAGQYADADVGDTLTYQATLADGNSLPPWLNFDSANLTFSGTTPTTEGTYIVKITATDLSQGFVSATLQITVQNSLTVACTPISPLRCSELGVALPFELDFTGSEVGITDINGLGTGFTIVDAYSGTRLSADGTPPDGKVLGHQPSKLTINDGKLTLITNKGIAYLANNNQLNALGVQVNSRGLLVIETTIIKPFNGSSGQQGGLWFGLNDKTYVKLIVIGNKVELRKEVNDISNATTADQRITSTISGFNNKIVTLKLIIDPVANTAEGFYSTDGTNFLNTGATYSTQSLSLTGSGLTNTTGYVGIFATHRNGTTPVTYTFEEFKISPSLAPVNANPVIVQAPANQVFGAGQVFSFSAGEFTDPDTADLLTYTATLDDGSALPSWLKFKTNNLTFNGTAPVVPIILAVKVTASDPEQAAISTNFSIEIQDTEPIVACIPMSTLPCSQILESQSVKLTFDGNVTNSIADRNGLGTGFTVVNNYSGTRSSADDIPVFSSIPGYEPTKLTLSNGRLLLATNKGSAASTRNNQLNALGVQVDNYGKVVQLETTLINPFNGTSLQQAGIWFGLNDKTFVQLAVIANKVELRKEIKDVSITNSIYTRITSAISNLNTMPVYLRLVVDLVANTAEGYYSTDGITYKNVGANYSPSSLSILNMGLKGTPVYGGIFGTHRNGTSPVTYTFDDFTLESSLRPYVSAVRPANGTTNVPLDASVSIELVYPSGKSINGTTVNTNTVKLYTVEVGGGAEVAGTVVNTTAAGDAITLSASLKKNTTYEFSITDQVQDGNGLSMIPFTSRFTTAGAPKDNPDSLAGIAFDEHTVVDSSFNSTGFTSLVIGPDHRLYAATSEGKIERWDIVADGTIQNHVSINLFGMEKRLLVGFHFDPAATPSNLIAWISHSAGAFLNAPNWSGKISKLDLTDPANPYIVDYVVNLPRSFKDHSTNSIDFGLDNALYFTQGSNSAMGDSDAAWGRRPETLLTAAVLRLDLLKAQNYILPINVKTEGPDGTYNPYADNAPLTIYATGVRNAYDLVWHSNGELYVPNNGSAAGGSTPALKNGSMWSNGEIYTGPEVPAMKDIRQTISDYLYRVNKGGYYGHPNILRNEYILNGGNPTERQDPGEIAGSNNGVSYGYPVGTPAEPNYRGWAFDFGVNISPNGVIEYKSNKFGGRLKGKLLVCRFSGKDDIVVLEPGVENKDIINATEGINIPGFRRPFANPLDIVEDLQTGNLYISEYYDGSGEGHPRLTLLKVKESSTTAVASGNRLIKNTINQRQQTEPITKTEATLIVYPNPNAGGLFSVALAKFGKHEAVKISIHDMSGKQIQVKTVVTNNQGAVVTELNIKSKLGQGLYFVKAQSSNTIRVEKLLVQ